MGDFQTTKSPPKRVVAKEQAQTIGRGHPSAQVNRPMLSMRLAPMCWKSCLGCTVFCVPLRALFSIGLACNLYTSKICWPRIQRPCLGDWARGKKTNLLASLAKHQVQTVERAPRPCGHRDRALLVVRVPRLGSAWTRAHLQPVLQAMRMLRVPDPASELIAHTCSASASARAVNW